MCFLEDINSGTMLTTKAESSKILCSCSLPPHHPLLSLTFHRKSLFSFLNTAHVSHRFFALTFSVTYSPFSYLFIFELVSKLFLNFGE